MNKDIIGYKTNDGEYRVVQKMRHSEKLIRSLLTDTKFSSRRGTAEVEEIFNGKFFSFPKPLGLLKDFISVGLEKDDFILDFFSGSATTAHAVMQLNAEDGGNRKYIMVQLPEETDEKSEAFKAGYKNICELGKERIRRAGEKIKEEIETANAQLKLGEEPKQVPDIGFKVFRTADTNIKWNIYNELGQIDTATMAHTPDLADFTYGFNDIDVVYEVMLRQKDVPLSSTLETLTDIGSRTYLYGSAYLVCLETEITETLIDKLAALDPLPIKFIFRDSAFKDDINLKDETFRRLKNLIERNSGLTKKTYTVEFI
jgi:adenine-specific DNA-methyltransferase